MYVLCQKGVIQRHNEGSCPSCLSLHTLLMFMWSITWSLIILSIIVPNIHVRLTGLWFCGAVFFPFYISMRHLHASIQKVVFCIWRNEFDIYVIDIVIFSDISWRTLGWMLSGPGDLFTFILFNCRCRASSVILGVWKLLVILPLIKGRHFVIFGIDREYTIEIFQE